MIGVSGTLSFTQNIKEEVKEFLNNTLFLTLSDEKTKITHLETEKVKYLGFLVSRRRRKYTESQLSTVKSTQVTRRPSYASVIIEAPIASLIDKLIEQGYAYGGQEPKPKAVTK